MTCPDIMAHSFALLRITQVMQATSLSRGSIYRRVRAGTFPAPVAISARRVAWRAAEIEAWSAALRKQALK